MWRRAAVAVLVLALSGCGGSDPSAQDTAACKSVRAAQQHIDATRGQTGDLRAAVLADYVALPGKLGRVDDEKLRATLDAAKAKQAEAEAVIPAAGGSIMGEALLPVLARCAELAPQA